MNLLATFSMSLVELFMASTCMSVERESRLETLLDERDSQ